MPFCRFMRFGFFHDLVYNYISFPSKSSRFFQLMIFLWGQLLRHLKSDKPTITLTRKPSWRLSRGKIGAVAWRTSNLSFSTKEIDLKIMATFTLDRIHSVYTGRIPNWNSMVPHRITFISGLIWYQIADPIRTGSTRFRVNTRLICTNFIPVPNGSGPV